MGFLGFLWLVEGHLSLSVPQFPYLWSVGPLGSGEIGVPLVWPCPAARIPSTPLSGGLGQDMGTAATAVIPDGHPGHPPPASSGSFPGLGCPFSMAACVALLCLLSPDLGLAGVTVARGLEVQRRARSPHGQTLGLLLPPDKASLPTLQAPSWHQGLSPSKQRPCRPQNPCLPRSPHLAALHGSLSTPGIPRPTDIT